MIIKHDLLPIALNVAKDYDDVDLTFVLSIFFQELCADQLSIEKLDELGDNVIMNLPKREKLFPTSFVTIMVHLIVHLIEEARLRRLILYMRMYLIERSEIYIDAYICNYLNTSYKPGFHVCIYDYCRFLTFLIG